MTSRSGSPSHDPGTRTSRSGSPGHDSCVGTCAGSRSGPPSHDPGTRTCSRSGSPGQDPCAGCRSGPPGQDPCRTRPVPAPRRRHVDEDSGDGVAPLERPRAGWRRHQQRPCVAGVGVGQVDPGQRAPGPGVEGGGRAPVARAGRGRGGVQTASGGRDLQGGAQADGRVHGAQLALRLQLAKTALGGGGKMDVSI